MTSDGHDDQSGTLAAASARGRWLIVAAVLGSGVAFLDGTVVNVALPAIARDLDTDLRGQQWVLDGYMLTLSALLLVGGVAGDRYGRRAVFVGGLVVFAVASGQIELGDAERLRRIARLGSAAGDCLARAIARGVYLAR